jgi:tetratricopeptide (TPR) repeat protein
MIASLARGLDAEAHGRPEPSARAYLEAWKSARTSSDPLAPVVAWYATNRILRIQNSSRWLWNDAKSFVVDSMNAPGSLGWRARGELVEWWARESYREARKDMLEQVADLHGCSKHVRLAGPFGRGIPADRHRSFEAEKPGRWPLFFSPSEQRPQVVPRVLETKRVGCEITPAQAVHDGVFYAETFFELQADEEVLISVQAARAVFVDDALVLERDPRKWGIWPSFGVRLKLTAGRHRLVARIEQAFTSIRLQRRDGTPLHAKTSDDPSAPYSVVAPVKLADPNVLNRYIRDGDVVRPKDDVEAFLAAYLAHVEGQDDVGSVLMEPLVSQIEVAAPIALAQQALLVSNDPAFPEGTGRDLARELHQKVVEKDPSVWRSRHWLSVDGARKRGLAVVAGELRDLAESFPEVEGIGRQLLSVYQELGWTAEVNALAAQRVKRFPDDLGVLSDWVAVLESMGKVQEADQTVATILKLDPDSPIELDRALRRQDYDKAISELERLGKLRPDRNDIATRLRSVLLRAGKKRETIEDLEKALRETPRDGSTRLALADARLAIGQHAALRMAVADAIEAGADTSELEGAIELLEGRTELEPYRMDGRKVIEEFESTGGKLDAAAVRVLDYGVTWVVRDGSSRLLEHEIVRVQSQDAIAALTEQRVPRGLVLRLRVIKKDGQILEPELGIDKPTLTMPHVEIGDYIETEWITSLRGDGHGAYLGPHWYFREQDIGYWRSEFVVISPTAQPLTIETNGPVPEPTVETRGPIEIRRWRVDKSPAAVIEPGAVPIRELLPNIRIGWGISLERRLRNLADSFEDQSIPDPRLRGIAQRIVKGIPKNQTHERARRVYRWILANIEQGEERDGRRIVTGRSGDLGFCFLYLARLLQIPTDIAVVKNGLEQPPRGPISEAESYQNFVLRIQTDKGDSWLTVRDRFTPFAYLPSALRGQPGYLLREGTPAIKTSAAGAFDGVIYEGQGQLRPTGAAAISLSRRFVGKYAIGVRYSIEQVSEAELPDVVESQLLSKDLPGASLVSVQVLDRDELDKPLTLQMQTEVPDFARRSQTGLTISPPFTVAVGALATLPSRQTTLLLGESSRIEIRVRIKLPPGAKVTTPLAPVQLRDEDRIVVVRDRVEGEELVFDRWIDLPAARIHPDQYGAFLRFARAADEATQRDIRIEIK